MNPLFHEAAQMAQLGWLMGVTTVLFLLAFMGWTAWAFAPSRRAEMDRASRLPFEPDGADA
jgi:cbb3-type cytochrome oxidase subunit 3